MAISISIPSQINVPQTTPKVNLKLASDNTASAPTINTLNNNTQSDALVQISSEGKIESPFIQVVQQASKTQNASSSQNIASNTVDKTPQQLRNLSQQKTDIIEQQSQLEQQEIQIDRELSLLQQKEVEINRKRFQLQQKTVGNLLNLKI